MDIKKSMMRNLAILGTAAMGSNAAASKSIFDALHDLSDDAR